MPQRPVSDSGDDHHAAMQQAFRWQVPARFNMAEVCSRRWAQAPDAIEKIAIIEHVAGAAPRLHSYAALQAAANRLSNALAKVGVRRGDRVAIVMPQRFETAVAYMAVLQLGAIAMPLSQLFGPEALEYRINDAGALAAICDEASMEALLSVRGSCPTLAVVIGLGQGAARADHDWQTLLATAADTFDAADTAADHPAVLIYTSGTTGPPKGALIPHRALIGNLPGFVCSQNWFGFEPTAETLPPDETPAPARGRAGMGAGTSGATPSLPSDPKTQSIFWSPADWAWTGGLMDALLPTLYFGRPIVAFNGRFSPELAYTLMQQHGILKNAVEATHKEADRYSMREIKWVPQIDVAATQKQMEDLSRKIRELNVQVQETNWRTEL